MQNIRYIQRRRELYTVSATTNSSLTLTPMTNVPKVVSIDKTNVSPVLKQTLTFTLNSDYTDALNAADLSVKVLANGYSRDLYIMSVDDSSSPKTFTAKFNGAPMGTYTFSVYASSVSQYGTLDTSALSLTTSSQVTGISPTQGSVYGGSVLTITGTNFSTVISDQAVKVGNTYCDIFAATTTQLTCRIRMTGLTEDANGDYLVLVVLAASSEATCAAANSCNFTFQSPSASITNLTAVYNPASSSYEVTAAGTGFTTGDL